MFAVVSASLGPAFRPHLDRKALIGICRNIVLASTTSCGNERRGQLLTGEQRHSGESQGIALASVDVTLDWHSSYSQLKISGPWTTGRLS